MVGAVAARGWQLIHPVPSTKLSELDRGPLITRLMQRADALPGAAAFCFSADAPVVLGTGPDGAPGRATVDDNLNGRIDERTEIGAVGSDDACLSPSDFGYTATLRDPDSFLISRGTFVPCHVASQADRFLVDGIGWVIVPSD